MVCYGFSSKKSGKGQGIRVVREIWLWQLNRIT